MAENIQQQPQPIPMTAEQIEAEEKIRDQMVAAARAKTQAFKDRHNSGRQLATAEPAQGSMAAMASKFVEKNRSADAAATAGQMNEIRKYAESLVTETRSLETALGILRRQYRQRVQDASEIDFASVRRGMPEGNTKDSNGNLYARNYYAIDRLRSLTAEMRTLLASDIRDSGLGDRFDPTSISSAAQEVSNALQGGWIIDDLTGQPAPGFKRLLGVLEFHLKKLRNLVEGTRGIGKQFDLAEAEFKSCLAAAEVTDAVEPKKGMKYIPNLPEPLAVPDSSGRVNFDPRNLDEMKPAESPVVVTPVQGGYKTSPRRSR